LEEHGVGEQEMRRVFNLGIGLVAVVPEAPAGSLIVGELR
jgi:phosphoribosylaminoimidazole (AIR) synthetase